MLFHVSIALSLCLFMCLLKKLHSAPFKKLVGSNVFEYEDRHLLCFSVYIIVNEAIWGFELLVGQTKQF